MKRLFIFTVLISVFTTLTLPNPNSWAITGVAPISGPVVRRFEPPIAAWLSGHRGVDLLGSAGENVSAAASGVITFAGVVAGRGVLTITHGELRTTYEPVTALVKVGETVATGQTVAILNEGHSCSAEVCLHWGLKRGDDYLDPLTMIELKQIRLLPQEAVAIVQKASAARVALATTSQTSPGLFSLPSDGTFGSPFGMRIHPIFNEERMHEGQDISAACGSEIRAAAAGVIQSVSYDDSGGNRLVLDHGQLGTKQLRTHYLHAQSYQVKAGQRVERGQILGKVGSTGWSTGCHLHFGVTLAGEYVNPSGFF